MGKGCDRYSVTHSYAPDPDRRKVEAALDFWAGALAESIMVRQLDGDTPLARLHFGPGLKARAKAIRAARPRAGTPGEE